MGNQYQQTSEPDHTWKRHREVNNQDDVRESVPIATFALSSAGINGLQRAIGNQAVQRVLIMQRGSPILRKAGTIQAAPPVIQRWGEKEHKEMGDTGSGGRRYGFGTTGFGEQGGISESTTSPGPKQDTFGGPIKLPFPFQLTHGDLNMLGDWFELDDTKVSKNKDGTQFTDALFVLAQRPSDQRGQQAGTWDEIIYAIYKNNPNDPRFHYGGPGPLAGIWAWAGDSSFSKQVKDRVNARYLRLASRNEAHFPTPEISGPSGHSYVELHEDALWRAYKAGQEGRDIGEGLAREAAAQHFLTDYFSAGHLRTPIGSVRDYWHQKYPQFFVNLKRKIAFDVAEYMNDNETRVETILGTVGMIYSKVLPMVEKETKDMPPFTLGDLVGRIVHDVDNEQGVWVVNDRGDRWLTYGDGRLHKAAPAMKENRTLELAAVAVGLGNGEIEHAFQIGAASNVSGGISRQDLFARIKMKSASPPLIGTKYAPEQVIPRLDTTVDNGRQNWQVDSIDKLWNLPVRSDKPITWGEAIKDNLEHGEIGSTLDDMASQFPLTYGPNLHPRAAYINGFLTPLKQTPYERLLGIIAFKEP